MKSRPLRARKAEERRVTKETNVYLKLNLDGQGRYKVSTTLPFLDHMLELFAKHSHYDLEVKASGDTHIDDHHLVEDVGIILGSVFEKALGDKRGIVRYGQFLLPMDESLAYVVLDLSGRPYFEYSVPFRPGWRRFDTDLFEDFFRAVAMNAKMNLHIKLLQGRNNHHIAEALFKGFARALSGATALDPRQKGIPSTKGKL